MDCRIAFSGDAFERLIRYRIRAQSMLRATGERSYERHLQEMNAHLRRRRMQWTTTSS